MPSIISLTGIEEAIANLDYKNRNALKYKLLQSIRGNYENEDSIVSIREIDRDLLVNSLWDTGNDPLVTKSKRRNLSSIKSSLNADLKKLYRDGKNSEGIIIGKTNVFEMADEAKDKILTMFTEKAGGETPIPLEQIADVLSVVGDLLSKWNDMDDSNEKGVVAQLKEIVQNLSKDMDLEEEQPLESTDIEDEIEEVEISDEDEVEDLEEVDVLEELDEAEEDIEDVDVLDEGEVEDLEEDLEEIEDDEDLEEVDVLEEADDAEEELEEVDILDGNEAEELEKDVEEIGDDEDLEEVDVLEEVDDVEEGLEEVDVLDEVEEADLEGDIEEIGDD